MKDRFSSWREIAVGAGVAVLVSGAVVIAQVSTGQVKRGQTDQEPCCGVVSIDAKAGTVTAKVTKTGTTFTITNLSTSDLAVFKVGGSLNISCAAPSSGGTGAVGSAASSGTGPCGSNVPRNANTKAPPPKDCIATDSAGVQRAIKCPDGYVIK